MQNGNVLYEEETTYLLLSPTRGFSPLDWVELNLDPLGWIEHVAYPLVTVKNEKCLCWASRLLDDRTKSQSMLKTFALSCKKREAIAPEGSQEVLDLTVETLKMSKN